MKKKDGLWEKAKKDFPKDPALQQVHYARLKIHEETKGMTSKEFVRYIKTRAKKVLRENGRGCVGRTTEKSNQKMIKRTKGEE